MVLEEDDGEEDDEGDEKVDVYGEMSVWDWR